MAQSSPEKAALKRCVFRRDLKERRFVQVISAIGSLFHSFGAATKQIYYIFSINASKYWISVVLLL
jgi:hypothetical protein